MKSMLRIMVVTVLTITCITNTQAEKRVRQSFNSNWKFDRFGPMPDKSERAEPKEIQAFDYDDSKWRILNLPHDWGIEGPFRQDLEEYTGKLPWRGIGWYRKEFVIPKADKGKKFFADFDGAMAYAEVYLNGKKVGGWPYGYTSFRVDLTKAVKFGQANVIAVRLDTLKWDSRWYPGAGIYRNVWLVKTNPVHISHWGVYLTTPAISKNKGVINLKISIDNESDSNAIVSLKTVIYEIDKNDKKGAKVAEASSTNITIAKTSSATDEYNLSVPKPKLWNIDTPNRYLAVTTVSCNGKIIDSMDTSFGFRTIKFSAYDGFLLNGKRVELTGVCNHHDLGPLGSAFNLRARERQLEILKEMGCNAIRTSHNPQEPELLDLCDKMGFFVINETFDTWFRGKRKNDYNRLFKKWYKKDIEALVKRDRNHPSVVLWSSGNEIPARGTPEGLKYSQIMTDLFHSLDPTRPATNGCSAPGKYIKGQFPKTVDVFGINYGLHTYKKFHTIEQNKNQSFYGSETASTVSSRGEYFFPVTQKGHENSGNTKARGDFQMSSYDNQAPGWGCSPDEQFRALAQSPTCTGEFVWTGFDYLGEPIPYNRDVTTLLNFTDPKKIAKLKQELEKIGKIKSPSRSSYFGIIDLCGLKKDRFYIYQAHWRPNLPMAHILPHWNWPERIEKVTPVHVYTSGDEAELFLNGKSLGRKKKEKYQYRLRWDDVVYQPGTLHVVAYKNGKKWAEDTVKTTDKPAKIAMSLDRTEIKADGKDMAFITVSVTDKNDLTVPRTHNELTFSVEGPAEIVAIGNGDATSHESYQDNNHKVFNGKCVIYLRSLPDKTGTVKVSATGENLEGSSTKLKMVNK